jgi:hypothetical protein
MHARLLLSPAYGQATSHHMLTYSYVPDTKHAYSLPARRPVRRRGAPHSLHIISAAMINSLAPAGLLPRNRRFSAKRIRPATRKTSARLSVSATSFFLPAPRVRFSFIGCSEIRKIAVMHVWRSKHR